MSRSGYTEDCDGWALIRWRGAVESAIRGRRGQAFFKDLLAALDALPEKRLIAHELEKDGEVCAIGALGKQRGIDMAEIDPEDHDRVASVFGIAPALAAEIVYMNDEAFWRAEPEWRFEKMRAWVASNIWPDDDTEAVDQGGPKGSRAAALHP
jgi:hypothetical protein